MKLCSLFKPLGALTILCALSLTMSSACSKDSTDDNSQNNNTEEPSKEPIETDSDLKFVEKNGLYGIEIRDTKGNLYASQPKPAIIRVKNTSGIESIYQAAYSEIKASQGGFLCVATVTTPNGSEFKFTDQIKVEKNSLFSIKRNVKVTKANPSDKGYSSQFTLISAVTAYAFNRFELFAPGFLYRNNNQNNPYESNPDLKSSSFCFRETQYGLPLFMAHDASSKKTISLSHINPKISSGIDEANSKGWTIASSVQYGSLGASMEGSHLCINYTYPSIAENARRSHPVSVGNNHTYSVAIAGHSSECYTSAAVTTYKQHFGLNNIALYNVDIEDAYTAQMDMFSALAAPITGDNGSKAYGLPWSISIPDGKPHAFELQNGFVGRQTTIAYHLMRYGKQTGNDAIFQQGLEMAKFWFADKQLVEYGLPRSWWIQTNKIDGYHNTYTGDFWTYPSFIRCVTDGMEGLLECVRLAEAYNLEQAEQWAAIINKFGEFILNAQHAGDGSFYRAYQKDGQYVQDVNVMGPWANEQAKLQANSKTSTLVPVRLLIRMYEWSGDKRYLDRAIEAGEYAYKIYFNDLGTFIGGTPDNANVVDKEAGVFAMYGFTALYQATGDKKWLQAAEYAAIFAFSYTYCYDFAIQGNDRANIFRNGGVSGYSLISAGAVGTDNFNANIYYELFKLHLLTEDPFYATAAKLLERNTKRPMDLDGTKGYAHRALLLEATTLCNLTFASVSSWLPWCGVANGEPMVNFYQTFGAYNISDVEKKSRQELLEQLDKVGVGGKAYNIR